MLPNGRQQVGSGYLIDSQTVLTVEHCTRDKTRGDPARALLVICSLDGRTVEAAVRASSPNVDIAVLDVPGLGITGETPPVTFGRVDRTHSGELRECEAIGYPLWQLDVAEQQRNRAEVRGTIRRAEGAEMEYLVLRDQLLESVAVPATVDVAESGAARSTWGGISGALVFHQGVALGLVVSHDPRQGASAIRLVAFDRVASATDEATRAVARELSISSMDRLQIVEADGPESGPWGVGAGRDTLARFIISGDQGVFSVDSSQRLVDACIPATEVFERVDVDEFAGREWLEAELDAFLTNQTCGYFIVEAEAGLGKTAFLAHLVRERGWIHHFSETAPGDAGVVASRMSLAAQLILTYKLPGPDGSGVATIAEGTAGRRDYLGTLLRQAAERLKPGEQLVVAIDALDEAGTRPGENVLGLPRSLPDGVFIVCSQRPVPVRLLVDAPRQVCQIDGESTENLHDMRAFLAVAVRRPAIAAARQAAGMEENGLITAVLDHSRGLWLYVHYVLADWGSGAVPIDLAALPSGLWRWYLDFFQRWRDEHTADWDALYLPVLATLAAIREPVTVSLLDALAGVRTPTTLLVGWRPLLAVRRGTERRYRLYHQSLVDFLEGRFEGDEVAAQDLSDDVASATLAAHRAIANRYLKHWGGLDALLPGLREPAQRDVDEGYGLRHLVAHLVAAGRDDELASLLAFPSRRPGEIERIENGWFAARDAVGDIPGYLTDLAMAGRRAHDVSQAQAEDGMPSVAIALELRYALLTSSIRDMAATVPAPLVLALVHAGVWSVDAAARMARAVDDPLLRYQQLAALAKAVGEPDASSVTTAALSAARELSDPGRRAHALAQLATNLPVAEKEVVLDEVVDVARVVLRGSMFEPAQELVELVAEVPEPRRHDVVDLALVAIRECEESEVQAEAIAGLAVHLTEAAAEQLLGVARRISDHGGRAVALAALAQRLPDRRRRAVIARAFALANDVEDPASRAEALEGVVAALPDSERSTRVPLLLAAVEQITEPVDRVLAVGTALGFVAASEHDLLVGRAMDDALGLDHPSSRAWAFEALLPWLDESGLEAAMEAFRAAGSPEETSRLLAAAARRFSGVRRTPILSEALASAAVIYEEPFVVAGSSTIGNRREVLAELAPDLPPELLPAALAAARRLDDDYAQAIALAASVNEPAAPADGPLLMDALDAASRAGDFDTGAAISIIAPKLTAELVPRALAIAASRRTDDLKQALVALAPKLPANMAGEAMELAESIPSEWPRAVAITALSRWLPTDARHAAQRRAIGLAGSAADYNEEGLPALAAHLDMDVLPDALAAARNLPPVSRSRALLALRERCVEPDRRRLLTEVLAGAHKLPAYEAASITAQVATRMEQPARAPLVEKVLKMLSTQRLHSKDLADEDDARAQLLTDIAPALADDSLSRAVDISRRLRSPWPRARALAALAPHTPGSTGSELFREALTATDELPAAWRLWAIAEAASLLPSSWLGPEIRGPLITNALGALSETEASHSPQQSPPLIDSMGKLAALLINPRAYQQQPRELLLLWSRMTDIAQRSGRAAFLPVLADLIPAVRAIGGHQSQEEAVTALRQTLGWFP
jgi:hypothetical protein